MFVIILVRQIKCLISFRDKLDICTNIISEQTQSVCTYNNDIYMN